MNVVSRFMSLIFTLPLLTLGNSISITGITHVLHSTLQETFVLLQDYAYNYTMQYAPLLSL